MSDFGTVNVFYQHPLYLDMVFEIVFQVDKFLELCVKYKSFDTLEAGLKTRVRDTLTVLLGEVR